jgi:hypothetical protein
MMQNSTVFVGLMGTVWLPLDKGRQGAYWTGGWRMNPIPCVQHGRSAAWAAPIIKDEGKQVSHH